MQIAKLPSEKRGHAHHGWLDTHHSFSFAHYYDPAHMGFLDLRVINDDVVKPAAGFPTHGHENMEIITYMIRGSLAHKDSTGSEGILKRGDVQMMSAGSGVRHSEFNGSDKEDLRLLQIWVLPQKEGGVPTYAQSHVSDEEKRNTLRLLVSATGGEGVLTIKQDVKLFASILDDGHTLSYEIPKGRGAWIQMVDGNLELNGTPMTSGDGAAIEDAGELIFKAQGKSEFLLFDLVK